MPTLLTLMESGANSAFTKVAFMLEQSGYSWVADEIHTDLQWEKGKLELEPYIYQEAEYMANTLLGDRGFIDVSRKGDLTRSIASRHQVAKEAWKRQSQRKTQRVVEELETVQKDVLKMFEEVDDFLRVKDKGKAKLNGSEKPLTKGLEKSSSKEGDSGTGATGATGRGHASKSGDSKGKATGKKSAKETGAMDYGMAVRMLQDKISTLNKVLENEIDQHERLLSERKKCYDILGGEPSDGPLDQILQNELSKFSKELGQSTNESETKKKQVSSLDKQVRGLKQDLSSQISQKNVQLEQIHRSLKQTERMLQNSREDTTDMARKRDIYKKQVDYWKERCELLEKTRRLGYYHISKVGQPVSLASAPASHAKRPVYYDPELLEVQDNVVYIRGDPVDRNHGVSNKTKNTPPPLVSSQKTKASQEATNAESIQKDYPGSPRKGVSQYHVNCVPDDDLNLNNNNSNSNVEQKSKAQKSTVKINSNVMSSLDRQRPQSTHNRNKHVSFSQNNNINKAGAVVKTSGVNVGPYTSNILPVHNSASQYNALTSERAAGTQGVTSQRRDVTKPQSMTSQKLGMATHRYEVQKPQTLPSGIYRPVPPPSDRTPSKGVQQRTGGTCMEAERDTGTGGKEIGDSNGRLSRMTSSGYLSYTNGMLGLDQYTQTSRPTSSTNPNMQAISSHGNYRNTTNDPEKTPKEKFEESLIKHQSASLNQSYASAAAGRTTNSQSNVGFQSQASTRELDQSYSSIQSKRSSGYSSLSSVNGGMTDTVTPVNSSDSRTEGKRMVTIQDTASECPTEDEHCRCCPRCCKEAPTSHPYGGYIS